MTEGLNVIKNLLSSFLPLFLAIIVPSVSPLYCSAIPRNAMGDGRGEGLIPLETRSERCITLSPCVPVREYRGSAHRARGLEYKQAPRFRLHRAVKSQGRRRKKGEDCPSGASSADPDGDRSDEPKSPITAAALLGSFFSLLRRMNK